MATKSAPAGRQVRQSPAQDFPRPFTTVDVLILTVLEDALKVLLVQRPSGASEPFPGQWALPGGYVDIAVDDDLEACARRKLQEKTAVASPYLEQLGSWGSAMRDPRGWSATHAYFALIAAHGLEITKGANAAAVAWFGVDEVLMPPASPVPLAFDHADILRAGVERLRSKVEYTSLPAFLLPEPFTLPQLQRTYEVVLGRPVDKSGFRTRMMAADFLEEVGVVDSHANRPPMGYRLKDRTAPVFFPRTFSPRR
ncbi:ADP-ribose pyrophosphatase YjhB, NUDIX family [Roseateles sp. YR242]|uniref:NUDIX hydrolase n=1 Tax=Roseateles sp. YR242 TaxID=1855305 RepID=UPI0008C8D20E|nr:NUDIX domain-containing protein [Roseateles sp. YR242]SEL07237.1 ADP-ribose pyrophosphatase YjhB, NUDIX family [Roseateles sp. YR242]